MEQAVSRLPRQEECAEKLREIRWNGQLNCVHCGSGSVVRNGKRNDSIQQYRCNSCGKSFNDRTKTVFSSTQMQLNECVYIIGRLRQDCSINEIRSEIGRSWKTVNDFVKALNLSVDPGALYSRVSDRSSTDTRKLDRFSETGRVDYSQFGC